MLTDAGKLCPRPFITTKNTLWKMLTFMKYHSYVIRNAHRPLWKQANRPGCLTFSANLASSLLTEGPLTQPSQGVVTACVTRHADMRQKAGTRRSEAQNMHARTHTFLLSAHASTHKRKRKAWTICSHTTHGKHTHRVDFHQP